MKLKSTTRLQNKKLDAHLSLYLSNGCKLSGQFGFNNIYNFREDIFPLGFLKKLFPTWWLSLISEQHEKNIDTVEDRQASF